MIVLIGIMMATLYKRSVSSISGLEIDPIKIRNWYWRVLISLLVLCAFLCYKSISSFHEADNVAEDQVQRSQDYASMLTFFLNVGFMILIVLCNVYSMRIKKVRILPYLFTFLIYAGFVFLDDFVMEDAIFEFKKINQLWQGEINFASAKGYVSLLSCAG
ncbi:MAG TPA: hypothetical protein VGB95_04005, partial [Chitinophagales bacterium]